MIAIQRQDRIFGVLAEAQGGKVRAQLFYPPCARTIQTIISLSYTADRSWQLPCYGTPWDCALDTAAGNGQFYATQDGRTWPEVTSDLC
ncbi:MAG: hypothetical protein ACKO0Z_09010 [Betaproteobacteria bacterium]